MCAGLSFHIDNLNRKELDRFYTPEEFVKQRKGDILEVFFWQKRPFLPVEEEDGIHLYDWGNRDATVKLPRTGWAKLESLRDGKWDWLSPQKIIIPADRGYEKRKWFKTPRGLSGIKVRYHNLTRVYLITEKASLDFIHLTGHDRMPVGKIVY
jgi:hypothetical protein